MLLPMVSHRHKVVTHLGVTLIKLYAQSMDGFGGPNQVLMSINNTAIHRIHIVAIYSIYLDSDMTAGTNQMSVMIHGPCRSRA